MDLRILVSRADRLGDLVLTLPAIAWVKRCTGAKISLHTSKYAADVGRWAIFNGIADELIFETGEGQFQGLADTYDYVLGFFHSKSVANLMSQCAYNKSFGPRTKISSIWTYSKTLAQHRSQARVSEMAYNYELALAALNAWELPCDQEFSGLPALKLPQDWTQGFERPADLVVSLSNGGSAQNWSVADYTSWIESNHLSDKVDFLVSGVDANERIEQLKAWSGFDSDRHKIITSFESVSKLVGYLSLAKRFVASSTGPLHLAHAAGVNVLGIYPTKKSESFARWRPDGYWHKGEVRWLEIES